MQILKEQLSAARVPSAVVGMWPHPCPLSGLGVSLALTTSPSVPRRGPRRWWLR